MPELIGGKWYIKEGDPLVLSNVEAVATENGTLFEVTVTQEADVFYFDRDLVEEFDVCYDNDDGPNRGRYYVCDPDYNKARKRGGLSASDNAQMETEAEPNPFTVQFINEYLDPMGALHSDPFAEEEEAKTEAENLFEVFTGEAALSKFGTMEQLAEALYTNYSFEALSTCECPICWKRKKH